MTAILEVDEDLELVEMVNNSEVWYSAHVLTRIDMTRYESTTDEASTNVNRSGQMEILHRSILVGVCLIWKETNCTEKTITRYVFI